MAIQKDFTLASGVTGNFWVPVGKAFRPNGDIVVSLDLYVDADHYQNGFAAINGIAGLPMKLALVKGSSLTADAVSKVSQINNATRDQKQALLTQFSDAIDQAALASIVTNNNDFKADGVVIVPPQKGAPVSTTSDGQVILAGAIGAQPADPGVIARP